MLFLYSISEHNITLLQATSMTGSTYLLVCHCFPFSPKAEKKSIFRLKNFCWKNEKC